MNPYTEVCLRYLDGDLTEAESREFSRLIATSPEAADELARHLIDEQYFTTMPEADDKRSVQPGDEYALDEALRYVGPRQDANTVLKDLLEYEREAPVVEILPIENWSETKPQRQPVETLTWGEVASATGDLLVSAAKTPAARWLFAAALVMAATVFYFAVDRDNQDANPPVTENPVVSPERPTNSLTPRAAVATLTAEHDAVWDRRPGQDLFAGQRFSLTEGFAEITTARGAKAILEAPATIELTDSDNAIRLHTGKLVGICETESSIGFLVRTPSAHIVDIGTSFGVQVSDDKVTTLQVYKGQVQIAPITQDARAGQPVSVLAGQATQSDIAKGLSIVDFEPRRFAAFFPSDRYRPLLIGDNTRWVDVLPVDLAEGSQVSEDAQIFIEQKGLVLDRDVAVNLVGRDRWPEQIDGPMRLLRAGDRVDIYLIHLDTPDDGKARQIRLTVDFGREILGVIAGTDDLASTDRFVDPDVRRTYPSAKPEVRRGLESQDSVVPGADGTSLELHLDIKQHIDQVRVLVRTHAPALRPHGIH